MSKWYDYREAIEEKRLTCIAQSAAMMMVDDRTGKCRSTRKHQRPDRGHMVPILSEHDPSTTHWQASSWEALSDVDNHVTPSLSEVVAHSNIGSVCVCAERERDHLEAP